MHWQSQGIEIREEHPKAASVLSGDEDEEKGSSSGNSTIKIEDAEEPQGPTQITANAPVLQSNSARLC
ncbi:Hypothetical protein FKW44_015032, partial [Caligus rogercresseyi]